MAKKFKDYYGKETADLIAQKIKLVKKDFELKSFVDFVVRGVRGKEFLARQDVFVLGFERFLGSDYSKNLKIFSKILGPELETEIGMFTYGYFLWPVGRYVEKHGKQNFLASMNFIYELTKRFTGEFAARSLLGLYPKKATKIILKWSKDKNVHVRRLASESLRIGLPWAKKSTVCLDQFKIYKKILSNLKNDESRFVQKSVGNNLNDLYKADKGRALEIIKEWQSQKTTKATDWIVKHGLRSLRKRSDLIKII